MLKSKKNQQFYFVYDVETTGLNRSEDRIVEITWLIMDKEGKIKVHEKQVINPEMPIPPETTAIHGIRNSDVLGQPTFKDYAPKLIKILSEYDPFICGYNNVRFDDQILENEFKRIGAHMPISEYDVIDVCSLYKKLKPRTLQAAAVEYLGEEQVKELEQRHAEKEGTANKKDAWHSSLFDTVITARVMVEIFKAHREEIPEDLEEFNRWLYKSDPSWIDMDGKFAYNENGQAAVNFGKKYKGSAIAYVLEKDPGYFEWMLNNDFANDTKRIVREILDGKIPKHR